MLSDFEIKLYESVYNNGLGKSHLLKFKEGKNYNVYLFYVENNGEPFVVCNALYGEKESCSFGYNQYFSTIESALKYFNVEAKE